MGSRALIAVLVFVVTVYVEAGQVCQGSPRMHNGKRCASTTWYVDGHKGACGCGPDNSDNQYSWNHNHLVTAPSQHFFDSQGKTWCGGACGKCIKLTTTGGFVDGQGGHVSAGQSHVFMVTNLCPNEYPNQSWCNQSPGNGYKNQYGYGEHFDLEDGAGQIDAIGWKGKNPEVTWEWSSCHGGNTPTSGQYSQCFCSHSGKK
ncbi:endoglucanase-like [Mercenaria mercenaria]|uniref:endoglucanase-like n=1 Tax=Mercenaria mercenaria TaxID=6596 RepID=UPI00234E6D9E|nr:endoglucanase-like [Mercenaria mercenaria]